MTQKKILLPQGFHDHLPPEAMCEMRLNGLVVNRLSSFGYELVRPAMMEFEESLDKDFSSDFFKVTDTISGKMMVIRNDITPQIARVVKDRYGERAITETVRLAYTGQVIRKQGVGKFTERQLTQTGFELVAIDSPERDAEVLYVAIETYQKAGIKDFTIDFCYPKLAEILLKEKGFSPKDVSKLSAMIEEKDINALRASKAPEEIINIIEISDSASNLSSSIIALEKIEKSISDKKAQARFMRTKQVLEILSKSVSDVSVSLNLLEVMGYTYHSGLCYSFISRQTFDEIGRGGRYNITVGKENTLDAAGFTFLINSMLRTIENDIKTEKKKVAYAEGFGGSKGLRDNGIVTIFE